MAKQTRKKETEEPQPLSTWDRYQLASHKDRPGTIDYVQALFTEFTELHGDRSFGDDPAVICGLARFEGQPVMVIGQEMGKEPRERQLRNFGMMHPEGYRKALRLMNTASRFDIPVLVFVDTKGAYPGVGAEERGQSEAIARNLRDMYKLRVPVVVTVIGAGASGGALGIAVGDRLLMMENAWYNVISPEGCAAIIWGDPEEAKKNSPKSAEALRITAEENKKLGVIDEIIREPNGGAHLDQAGAIDSVREAIRRHLAELATLSPEQIIEKRFDKYRKIGIFSET
ncbi:acetyl-CoA carboxylase carboxyltransferase subunit alpha [Candidatus Sumerlaeota bacterium]|nr:acetyl-CoA carboxylase carboxyltransferase subunit alpha [Candidatus Sumerlaeota bacterium]